MRRNDFQPCVAVVICPQICDQVHVEYGKEVSCGTECIHCKRGAHMKWANERKFPFSTLWMYSVVPPRYITTWIYDYMGVECRRTAFDNSFWSRT